MRPGNARPALTPRGDDAFRREQYRSLTRLMPVMYAVILTVTVMLVGVFHATAPAWLALLAPGLMSLVVITRTIYWVKARRRVDTMTPDALRREIRSTTVLGAVISFGFAMIGLELLHLGTSNQQSMVVVLIWILAVVSGFCLHANRVASVSVVVAATGPIGLAFVFNSDKMMPQLAPVFTVVTGLIIYMLLEIYKGFAKIVGATEDALASEARVTHLAYHDGLTGLANRLLFANRLDHALETLRLQGGSFAVLCIDLDRFKEVNDTFGHEAGDDLIRVVSRMVLEACGPSDILARLGGDEFAILQAGAGQEEAATLAARLIELMGAPIQIAVGRAFIGCSVGVALVRNGAVDGPECMRQADLALYRAKDEGRGRFAFYEPGLDTTLRTRVEIRDELREALAREELTLHYQAQIEDGAVRGFEALARWNHPVRGPMSPAVFVPIAEESGLIEALGEFTLRRAFLDSKRFGGLLVAINVSAAQVRMREFIANLKALMDETEVDPTIIELEITEGLLLGDDESTRETLRQARALGFRIALDDFGTGYSSLGYLQRYPIDKIKIDRSFVCNLGEDPNADAVVSAIVRLARALRLDVVAEGVETDAQRLRLAAAGCGAFQGYLFSKAVPMDEALDQVGARAAPLAKRLRIAS